MAALDLPTGEIGIDDKVGLAEKGGTEAHDHHKAMRSRHFRACGLQALVVKELVDGVVGHDAEDAVVGDGVGDSSLDAIDVPREVVRSKHDGGREEGENPSLKLG